LGEGFAVIDVVNDGKIADVLLLHMVLLIQSLRPSAAQTLFNHLATLLPRNHSAFQTSGQQAFFKFSPSIPSPPQGIKPFWMRTSGKAAMYAHISPDGKKRWHPAPPSPPKPRREILSPPREIILYKWYSDRYNNTCC
jgi:hypothetical protein